MALAAIIVSALAFVAAGVAVVYTRRQALAAARQADIEEQRRADEVAPTWSASFTREERRPRILLTNNGPSPARAARAELVRHAGHPALVTGLGTDQTDRADQVELGDVLVGETREIIVGEDQQRNHGGEVRLRVEAQDGANRASTRLVRCDVAAYVEIFASWG
jgi:hypothetical protein